MGVNAKAPDDPAFPALSFLFWVNFTLLQND
jgi:hypothetical protein